MGFEDPERIQDLYLAGKKDEAMLAVPTELTDEISLVGSVGESTGKCVARDPRFILVGIYTESWRTANVCRVGFGLNRAKETELNCCRPIP